MGRLEELIYKGGYMSPEEMTELAYLYLTQEDIEEAENWLVKAISLGYNKARKLLAQICILNKNDKKGAISLLREYIDNNSDGKAVREAAEEAILEAEKGVAVGWLNIDAYRLNYNAMAVSHLIEQGDFEEEYHGPWSDDEEATDCEERKLKAVQHYEHTFCEAKKKLFNLYMSLGDKEKSKYWLSQMEKIDAKDVKTWAFYFMDFKGGISLLKKSADDGDPEAAYQVAKFYMWLDKS